jgi:large conductance mechanosensitive channel protein
MDLAVGVIIGGAFGKIVDSVVDDVIMPIVGTHLRRPGLQQLLHPAGRPDRDDAGRGEEGRRRARLRQLPDDPLNFIILAFIIFLMIKQMNRLKREAPPPPPPRRPHARRRAAAARDPRRAEASRSKGNARPRRRITGAAARLFAGLHVIAARHTRRAAHTRRLPPMKPNPLTDCPRRWRPPSSGSRRRARPPSARREPGPGRAGRDASASARRPAGGAVRAQPQVRGVRPDLQRRLRRARAARAGLGRRRQRRTSGSGRRHGSWDALSLVEDHEVEAQISAERFGMEIAHACEWELRELGRLRRDAAARGSAAARGDRNPLRPELVGHALMRGIEAVSDRPRCARCCGRTGRSLAALLRPAYADIVGRASRNAGVQPHGLTGAPGGVAGAPAAATSGVPAGAAAAEAPRRAGFSPSGIPAHSGRRLRPATAGHGRAAHGPAAARGSGLAPRGGTLRWAQVDPALMSLLRRLGLHRAGRTPAAQARRRQPGRR